MNKNSYTIQKFCRICNNTNLTEVLSLGNQYLSGIFPKTENEAVINAPLSLVKCIGKDSCGLVQMRYNFNSDIMYGENYGYRSGLNSSMVKHLENKTEIIKSIIDLESDDIVLDIGSNDGTTLSFFKDSNLNLVGIDPTANNFIDYYPEEITVIPNFFSSKLFIDKYKSKKAKVIFSLSMFYDLPKPLDFMREIKSILDVNGIWVVEQSYLPFMLETNSYDTVCHEHYEYYSIKDIKKMTDKLNLKIVDIEFNDINGGSFSLLISHNNKNFMEYKNINDLLEKESYLDDLNTFKNFKKNIDTAKDDIQKKLSKLVKDGHPVAGIGASTKGNVMLQYSNINTSLIECIGEVNKEKIGCFTPGTNIPIVSEDDVLRKYDFLLVIPWHFKEFFLKNKKFKGKKLIFALPQVEILET